MEHAPATRRRLTTVGAIVLALVAVASATVAVAAVRGEETIAVCAHGNGAITLDTGRGCRGNAVELELATGAAIDALRAENASLIGRVEGLEAEVAGLEGQVQALSSTVAANTAAIDAVEADVAANTDDIAANSDDISSLEGRVSGLETRHPEISCTDGVDNDRDGLTDGADPDCAPLSCRVAFNTIGDRSGAVLEVDGLVLTGSSTVTASSFIIGAGIAGGDSNFIDSGESLTIDFGGRTSTDVLLDLNTGDPMRYTLEVFGDNGGSLGVVAVTSPGDVDVSARFPGAVIGAVKVTTTFNAMAVTAIEFGDC